MDVLERQRVISSIACGKVFFELPPHGTLCAIPPSPHIQAIGLRQYNIAYNEAILNGAISRQELLCALNERKLWTDKDETVLSGLQEDVRKLRRGMLDYIFQTDKLEVIRSTLRNAEKALFQKILDKESLLNDSAEAYALTQQQSAMLMYIVTDIDGKRLWGSERDFESGCDANTLTFLIEVVFNTSVLSTAIIRELARTEPWRSIWCASKIGSQIFENAATFWSANQTALVAWSTLYDSVYEAYERPSSQIIGDDDLLDSWMIRESEKADKTSKQNSIDKISPKSNKAGRQEVFVMTDEKGAKSIYEANDAVARKTIQQRQSMINKLGTVPEERMPDSQQEIRMQAAQQAVKKTKDISHGR